MRRFYDKYGIKLALGCQFFRVSSSVRQSVSTFARPKIRALSLIIDLQTRSIAPTLKEGSKILIVSNSAWNIYNFRLSLVRALRDQGCTVYAVAPTDRYAARLAAEQGVVFVPLRHLQRKSLSVVGNLQLLFELKALYARLQPDLIIHYTIKPNIFGSLAAYWTGCASASSLEGQGYIGNNGHLLRQIVVLLYRLAFRAADRVIFLNENDQQEFLDLRLLKPEKAVLIHGPGVDTEYFKAAPKPKGNPFVFLFLGRLLGEKGIREYVEAARLCHEKGLPVEFQILGNPDPDNPTTVTQQDIDAWIKSGHIRYLGYTDDVRPALRQADVVVLPSMYREGVPRSLLEAMAMSKVIVTTDRPGCRDTVEVGKNGFVVEPESAAALAATCERCVHLSDVVISEMAAYGREMVKREFDDPIVIGKYIRLINSILRKEAYVPVS